MSLSQSTVVLSEGAGVRTSSAPRLYSIQILRGLAALLVVLHHQFQVATDAFASHPSLVVFDTGAFGVDIFFPISGVAMYLAASNVLRRGSLPPAWKDFAWRRFLRITPLYWFFTLLKLSLFLAVPTAMLHYRFQLWNTVSSFLFLPSYNNMHVPEPVLPVGWTLAYEMFFYLIVTLAIALRRPLLRWCASIIVALSIIGLVIPHSWGGLTYLADPIELEFLFGMLIASVLPRLQRVPAWLPTLVLPAALAFALCFPVHSHPLEFLPQRVLFWGIPGALIVWSALVLESRISLIRLRALLLLGDASFSLYLSHPFIIPAARYAIRAFHLHGSAGLVLFLLLGQLICIPVAILFHLYVETPMLRALTQCRTPWTLRSAVVDPARPHHPSN